MLKCYYSLLLPMIYLFSLRVLFRKHIAVKKNCFLKTLKVTGIFFQKRQRFRQHHTSNILYFNSTIIRNFWWSYICFFYLRNLNTWELISTDVSVIHICIDHIVRKWIQIIKSDTLDSRLLLMFAVVYGQPPRVNSVYSIFYSIVTNPLAIWVCFSKRRDLHIEQRMRCACFVRHFR